MAQVSYTFPRHRMTESAGYPIVVQAFEDGVPEMNIYEALDWIESVLPAGVEASPNGDEKIGWNFPLSDGSVIQMRDV